MEKIKPRITDFKNDLVFKYLLSNMKDEQCRRLLKLIIEDVMDIKCKKINVLNSELNPHHISDKDMILDIQVITEDGELVDIEMQNSIFSKELYHRLQAYEARMIDHQVNRGDERYSDHLHKVNLITFINDIDKDNLVLIDSYVPRNEYGNVRKFNLATSYFVQLPFIKVIEKEKRLENFSRLEILIYILYHGLTHDIISLDNEVVTIMKDKMEQFNEDEELVLAAEKRQLVKIQHYHEGQRMQGLEYTRPVKIYDHVWIGGNVTILPGVKINQGAIIGAGSVVTHDIPPYVIATGNPCRVLRSITKEDLHKQW